MVGLPGAFRRLLAGGDAPSRRRPRTPDTIAWELQPGAVHPSQGGFVVTPLAADVAPSGPTVELLDTAAAAALAAEVQALSQPRDG